MYQVQVDALPPVAAGMHRPEGSPPDNLHFADGDYSQNSALEAPELERWVTGYSNDSGTPKESAYLPGSVYEYAPESYYEEEEEDYYYSDEEYPTRKLLQLTNSFLLQSLSCLTSKIQSSINLPCCAC